MAELKSKRDDFTKTLILLRKEVKVATNILEGNDEIKCNMKAEKAMQLKAYVKNLIKEKNISAQIVLQNYMLERLLERISVSKYHDNFFLKGGFFGGYGWT